MACHSVIQKRPLDAPQPYWCLVGSSEPQWLFHTSSLLILPRCQLVWNMLCSWGREWEKDLAREFARRQAETAGACQKRADDQHTKGTHFSAEDLIWVYWPKRVKGKSPILRSDRVGPCWVLKRVGEVVYRCRQKNLKASSKRNHCWTVKTQTTLQHCKLHIYALLLA